MQRLQITSDKLNAASTFVTNRPNQEKEKRYYVQRREIVSVRHMMRHLSPFCQEFRYAIKPTPIRTTPNMDTYGAD